MRGNMDLTTNRVIKKRIDKTKSQMASGRVAKSHHAEKSTVNQIEPRKRIKESPVRIATVRTRYFCRNKLMIARTALVVACVLFIKL